MKHSSLLKYILYIMCLAASALQASAQELNCTVTINADQVEGTNKSVFEALQAAVSDYMNTTVFTNAQFANNEKIDCRLFFTIKEYDGEIMTGDLQVQSTRPVYNSSYTTTLLNFKDSKIDFAYRESHPLVFSENNMESQLTAILNFYAYLFLALDFDSFSPQGGTPYFERLAQIVQMAQSSGEVGWKAFEDNKNRSALLSAYTDPATEALRQMNYDYHRQGFDQMSVSVDKGRAKVTETLNVIKNIFDKAPMSVSLSLFKDAKLDELVNLYSKAPADERNKVYNLLEPIYPTERERLEEIKNGAQNK